MTEDKRIKAKNVILDVSGKTVGELQRIVIDLANAVRGRGAVNILTGALNAELMTTVREHTRFLDSYDFFSDSTRLYVFAHGLTDEDLPRCPTCGAVIRKNVVSLRKGFRQGRYCSVLCAANGKARNEKRNTTMMNRYGQLNYNNRAAYTETCLERYGVKSNFCTEEFKSRSAKTKTERYGNPKFVNHSKSRETKERLYGDPEWHNAEKSAKTKAEKSAVDPNYYRKSRAKADATKLKKYGDRNFNNREKAQITKTERYGDANFNNREKAQGTCLKKYGVDNPLKSAKVRRKARCTCMRLYGESNYTKTDEYREKARATCRRRYGADSYMASAAGKAELSERRNRECYGRITARGNEVTALFSYEEYKGKDRYTQFRWRCEECGLEFEDRVNFPYALKTGRYARCPFCHPKPAWSSVKEKEMAAFAESVAGTVSLRNDRTVIAPREIDAYFPSLGVGFEFDGTYWHSTFVLSGEADMADKADRCDRAGVRVFHVFEDDWELRRTQTEAEIKRVLSPVVPLEGAFVREIGQGEATEFYAANSMDLPAKASATGQHVAVMSGGVPVAVCSFGRSGRKLVVQAFQEATWAGNTDAFDLAFAWAMENVFFAKSADIAEMRLPRRWPRADFLGRNGFGLASVSAPRKWLMKIGATWERVCRRPPTTSATREIVGLPDGELSAKRLYEAGFGCMADCGSLVYRKAVN